MHEADFTRQIVAAVLDELKRYPTAKPSRVKVRVGEMLHLLPDSVRAHYELLARGTGLEGIELELEEVPVVVRCLKCGHEGLVEDHHLLFCPGCASFDVELVSGDELKIEAIEIEEVSP